MSTITAPDPGPATSARARRAHLNRSDRRGNALLRGLTIGGGCLLFIVMAAIVIEILSGASQSFNRFGLAFIFHKQWIPNLNRFGALAYIYGSLVSSVFAVILAGLLGVSIGLFLALLSPRWLSQVIGPLVELLASVPSIVLGLIGVILINPFILHHFEPALHAVLGWTPFFGAPGTVGNSYFAAILVLTIMVVPIVSALSRDLFLTVPQELRDGAEALGATRWEMIRGIVLPVTRTGVVAACVLGFGRAVGEAIAVSFVIGGVPLINANMFERGNTLAANVANQYLNAPPGIWRSSLFYLVAILLVLLIITNLTARYIATRGTKVLA